MRTLFASALFLSLVLGGTAAAQQSSSLTRSEVTAIRAKLVAVQQAMGADPSGYVKESEDFNLPTDFNPAKDGKFWPITSSIQLRYTDKASSEGQATAEKALEEFQTKYAAAAASGNVEALTKMTQDLQKMQAAALTPPVKKEPLNVNVQLNQNPTVGIDPAAVVLERAGVIALREKNVSSDRGSVTVYVDPVAPAMSVHEPPEASHCCHWRVKAGEPIHVPSAAVSVEPTVVVPEIDGGAVTVGAVAEVGTTAVAAEVPDAVPALFVAVSTTRIV